jgi:hypothetical protein
MYNAHGHKVASMHSDSERVDNSLSAPLGSIGIQPNPPYLVTMHIDIETH